MSYKDQFSFTRAINSLLKRGSLLDAEGFFDLEIRKRLEFFRQGATLITGIVGIS
jgi:hypothetical protein